MPQDYFKKLDDLYREILFRPIDPSGFRSCVDLMITYGKSLGDIRKVLCDSEELRQILRARERAKLFYQKAKERGAQPDQAPGLPPIAVRTGGSNPDLLNETGAPLLDSEARAKSCYLHVDPAHLVKQQTPGSILVRGGVIAEGHSVNQQERRYATCSDVAWFGHSYLATINLLGDALHLYRFDETEGSLELLQSVNEGMNWPEALSISTDKSLLAITHSGNPPYISVHDLDIQTPQIKPGVHLLEPDPGEQQLHGMQFTPDGRFLVFTYIGDSSGLTVVDSTSMERVCRVDNEFDPLKPKSAGFSPDGRRMVVSYARNAGNLGAADGALALYQFNPESGILDPKPLHVLKQSDCGLFQDPETLEILPNGRYIAISNLSGEFISLFLLGDNRLYPLRKVLENTSLSYPHGVGASRDMRFLAVTNYGDDTLQLHRLSRIDLRVILLVRDPERTRHVNELILPDLNRMGVPAPMVLDACDGHADQDFDRIVQVLDLDSSDRVLGATAFMRRKLACCASHLSAWETVRKGIPAMVLEDDAVLAADGLASAAVIVDEANRLFPGWHLIYLWSNCHFDESNADRLLPLGTETGQHHGNVGYIISSEGAATLSDLVRKHLNALEPAEFSREQNELHFGLDLTIMHLARADQAKVLWSSRRLVETVGQVGSVRKTGDLQSNIYQECPS